MERDENSRSPVCETGILTTRLPIQRDLFRYTHFYINFLFLYKFYTCLKNIEKDNIRFPRRNHVDIYFDSQSSYQF
jgi:hypothetical protein